MRASVWWAKYKGEDFPPVKGALLWSARIELGLSQRAAAAARGLRPWRIGAVERGDIWVWGHTKEELEQQVAYLLRDGGHLLVSDNHEEEG